MLALAVVVLASAAGVVASSRIQGDAVAGKKAYRTYCGQCHALAEANAALARLRSGGVRGSVVLSVA